MIKLDRDRLAALLQRILRASTPVIALVLIGLVYFLGVRTERTGFVREVLDPGLKRITRPVLNAFRGRPPEVQKFRISLDPAEVDTLEHHQEEALEAGWVEASRCGRSAVQIEYKDRQVPAILSLKEGAAPIDGRWTFVCRLLPGDTLLGMRTFQLTPVRDGGALRAWFLSHGLQDLGQPAYGAELVEVVLTDGNPSLCLMQALAEDVRVPWRPSDEIQVLRFDDGLLMNVQEGTQDLVFPIGPIPQADWMAAPIVADPVELLSGSGSVRERTLRAAKALDAFRAGTIPAGQVFHAPNVAKSLAFADLVGAQRAFHWSVLRMVIDSASGKLDIVPYHGESFIPISSILADPGSTAGQQRAERPDLRDRLLADPAIYASYIAYLDTFSTQGWSEKMMLDLAPDLSQAEAIVMAELPHVQLDRSVLEHDREVIRLALRPGDLALAYMRTAEPGRSEVVVANVHSLKIQIRGLLVGTDTIDAQPRTVLDPREPDKPLRYSRLSFSTGERNISSAKLLANLLGSNELRTINMRRWSILDVQ